MVSGIQTDVLSDVFEQVEVEGVITGGFAIRGSWVSQGLVRQPFKLIALVAGSATVTAEGADGVHGPVPLGPGDVALLNHRTRLEVRGGSPNGVPRELVPQSSFDSAALSAADLSRDDVLVGGAIRVHPAGRALLAAALPGLVCAKATSETGSRLASLVAQLFEEGSSGRLGSAFAIRQNGQLLLLEFLRSYLEQEQVPTGWLRLLTDESLMPAVRLMHAEPGSRWGLAELASAAGMSRTVFAERFRAVAGIPPLAYLLRWRMLLAQRALHNPNTRVGTLAAELGYASESAFSNAFKREVGHSPLQHRRESGSTHRAAASTSG
ncbi:AraC family transcriptional regulator [Curtobacterium pusillum]|uniref:AraC family transcriptional regulator n=1 Tax=Curtobacterium pusillum TaxID=69373 RepID=UPI00382D3E56